MNKEFVPYKEALALKKLGFDEPCMLCYIDEEYSSKSNLLFSKFEFINSNFENNKFKKNSDFNNSITAPTFSQVFRWFRESHKIHINIQQVANYEGQTIGFFYEILGENDSKIDIESDTFKTYDETELVCLQKLIEIIKK